MHSKDAKIFAVTIYHTPHTFTCLPARFSSAEAAARPQGALAGFEQRVDFPQLLLQHALGLPRLLLDGRDVALPLPLPLFLAPLLVLPRRPPLALALS